jgi:hypothetical protein
LEEERHYLSDGALWGCGVNCGFKAMEKSWPRHKGQMGREYCPWCGQEGKNLVGLMPLGKENELMWVWDEEEL